MIHTHTHTHTRSVGLIWTRDRPVAETSTWQNTTVTTDIHAPGGIRTHNPTKWADAEPRLSPRGHWDRLVTFPMYKITSSISNGIVNLQKLFKQEKYIHKVFIQSQHINIQSTVHSFGYMFRFYQTILRPIFIIWRYVRSMYAYIMGYHIFYTQCECVCVCVCVCVCIYIVICIHIYIWPTALEGGEGSASRPGRYLPPGKSRYPLYRRLGGP